MSFKNLAWAGEQSQISASAKLLAIFIATNADLFGKANFAAQDAAAWCCFSHVETAERLTYELANKCGLQVVRTDNQHDIMTFEVVVPSPSNGGDLI